HTSFSRDWSSDVCSSDLPFAQIDGPAAQTVTPVGALTLRYSGEDELAFDYSVDGINQGKTLSRFPFGARSFACATSATQNRADRSEERRVGNECRTERSV